MTAPERLRVGFVGAGLIARYHAMQLEWSTEANEIVAVHDPDASRADGFARAHGGVVLSSTAEVVAAADVVFVCTWTAAHLDAVREAAMAGRAVFCEKPLSTDLEGAREGAAIIESTGVVNMAGLVLRSSPAMAIARHLVTDPSAGRVMSVVFRDDQYLPTQGMYASTWRGDAGIAGSGVLMEHSIHDLDLLEWLVAPLATVSAQQASFHGIDGIEDTMSVVARFDGGATAVLTTVWHDVLSRPSQRRIEVICESAIVTIEGDVFGPVHCERSDTSETIDGDAMASWLAERDVALASAESEFLRVVRDPTGSPARPDVRDALRAHVLVDAVYRSARAGGDAVAIPDPVGGTVAA